MQDCNQGLWNRIASKLNAPWQTDWAIQDQARNLNSIWLWQYTWLLLISMLCVQTHTHTHRDTLITLWNRGVISNKKETSCHPLLMQDSNLGTLRYQIANRLNSHSQNDCVIEDQVKNLNSTVRPHGEWALNEIHIWGWVGWGVRQCEFLDERNS